MFFKDLHPANAYCPTYSALSPMTTLSSAVQSLNNSGETAMWEFPMTALLRDVHPWKTPCPV